MTRDDITEILSQAKPIQPKTEKSENLNLDSLIHIKGHGNIVFIGSSGVLLLLMMILFLIFFHSSL